MFKKNKFNFSDHTNIIKNKILLDYNNYSEEKEEEFKKNQSDNLIYIQENKIRVIDLLKRKLKENANSFLGTRLTIFTVFIVQLIIMYYPFYVIFKNIFSHDMIGLITVQKNHKKY